MRLAQIIFEFIQFTIYGNTSNRPNTKVTIGKVRAAQESAYVPGNSAEGETDPDRTGRTYPNIAR